nr:MAG TPA: hypothetical protein [Caudoviricetes sp.]
MSPYHRNMVSDNSTNCWEFLKLTKLQHNSKG